MKTMSISILLFLTILFSCTNNATQESGLEHKRHHFTPSLPENPTTIKFDRTEIDTGEIEEGPVLIYEFPFTNTGKHPFIITNCKGGGGGPCVWPKISILPNERGVIKGHFYTKNRTGKQRKNVTITANTIPPNTVLTMAAQIKSVHGEFEFEQRSLENLKETVPAPPKIRFEHYECDMGDVLKGPSVKYEFPFTNTGGSPLIFKGCRRSSSDLKVDYPREPILPGDSGILKIELPTTVKTHQQSKYLLPDTNAEPSDHILSIKANILVDEK